MICVWMNGWVNNREAGDLRRHCANYDATVMEIDMFVYRSTVDTSLKLQSEYELQIWV